MRSKIFFLLISVAAALAIIFAIAFLKPWETQRILSEPVPTASPTPPLSAIIQNCSGQGTIMKYGTAKQESLQSGNIVNEGDLIQLEEGANIEILFSSGALLSAANETSLTVGVSLDDILGRTPLITMTPGSVNIVTGSPIVLEVVNERGTTVNAVALHNGSAEITASTEQFKMLCKTPSGCRFSNQTGYYDLESGPDIVFSSPDQPPEMVTYE